MDERQRSASFQSVPSPSSDQKPQLRPIPGYGSNSPVPSDFLTNRIATPPSSQIPTINNPSVTTPTTIVTPSSKPYQSREHVYYTQEQTSTAQQQQQQPATKSFLGGISMPLTRTMSDAELKVEAPPTGSLYDDPLSPERPFLAVSSGSLAPTKEIDYIAGVVASSPSRIQTQITLQDIIPSVNLSSSDPIDSWVTVFGFSGAQAQSVLSYFKSLGNVIKTELGQRNWIHIQYDSPWAAQKALLKNGIVLPAAGSCMIGVLPTRQAMEQVGHASTSFMSPLKKSETFTPSPFGMTSSLPGPSKLSNETSNVPQTPGFPQASLYTTTNQQHAQPSSQQPAPFSSIFANEVAKAKTTSAQEADIAGNEGLLTKTFNYIFGF